MNWQAIMTSEKMSLAAVAIASISLFFSLITAFPQIKGVIVVIRDAVLWLALCAVVGGVGYVFYCQYQQSSTENSASSPEFSNRTRLNPLPTATPPAVPAVSPPLSEPSKPRATIRETDVT